MAIHITWKEIAARVKDTEQLEKLASVLEAAEATVPIVYFEFESPQNMLEFCKAVKMVPFIHTIDELKAEMERMGEEKVVLQEVIRSMTEERDEKKTLDDLRTEKERLCDEIDALTVKRDKKQK